MNTGDLDECNKSSMEGEPNPKTDPFCNCTQLWILGVYTLGYLNKIWTIEPQDMIFSVPKIYIVHGISDIAVEFWRSVFLWLTGVEESAITYLDTLYRKVDKHNSWYKASSWFSMMFEVFCRCVIWHVHELVSRLLLRMCHRELIIFTDISLENRSFLFSVHMSPCVIIPTTLLDFAFWL